MRLHPARPARPLPRLVQGMEQPCTSLVRSVLGSLGGASARHCPTPARPDDPCRRPASTRNGGSRLSRGGRSFLEPRKGKNGTFTDSRGYTYRVAEDCSLTQIDAPEPPWGKTP